VYAYTVRRIIYGRRYTIGFMINDLTAAVNAFIARAMVSFLVMLLACKLFHINFDRPEENGAFGPMFYGTCIQIDLDS
jgi:hypothetical protein